MASECTSLAECKSKRDELSASIATKQHEIEHGMMGIATEPQRASVRAVNDEINKLMRVRHQWEQQLARLEGSTTQATPRGTGGEYAYFGVARELDEVKAHLAQQPQLLPEDGSSKKKKKTSRTTTCELTPDYYGLVSNENELARAEEHAAFSSTTAASTTTTAKIDSEEVHWDESWRVPTREDVDQSLLQLKKKQLMQKYQLLG